MQVITRLALEPMSHADIATVQAIERQVFVSPWPKNAYATELSHNPHASYIVLRRDGDLVGYAGLWKLGSEAHVTTIGVRAEDQGNGYGKVLLGALVVRALELKTHWLTLEVRSGNLHAIGLYESFGFKAIGRRLGYYTDNGEDAIVMWSDSLYSQRFERNLMRRLEGIDAAGLDLAAAYGKPAGR